MNISRIILGNGIVPDSGRSFVCSLIIIKVIIIGRITSKMLLHKSNCNLSVLVESNGDIG
jgi:hypothetical protein